MDNDGNANVPDVSAGTEGQAEQANGGQANEGQQNNPFGFPTSTTNTEGAKDLPTGNEQTNDTEGTEKVPEKYTFSLPEGLKMSPEIESRFTEIAKGLKLTQEQADGLVKLHSDIMLETMKTAEAQKDSWVKECQKAGLATPDKLDSAKLAVESFDETGKLMDELIQSGLAYSPNMQRFLQLIGSYLKEDNVPDSKSSPSPKNAADLLFNNSSY